MNLPIKELLKEFEHSNYHGEIITTSLDIQGKDISILLLCLLFHNKLLTKKQLCAYFNKYDEKSSRKENPSYKDDTLTRRINTYHSKINDKWYNDYNFTSILLDICKDECTNYEMSFDDLLKYLNIGFSKNKNWCIDFVTFNIIKPIIEYYDVEKSYKILNKFGLDINYLTYEEADLKYDLSLGYCCEDCDGCYSQYKRSKYEYYYKGSNKQDIKNMFKTELKKYKTHFKNPNDKLLYDF